MIRILRNFEIHLSRQCFPTRKNKKTSLPSQKKSSTSLPPFSIIPSSLVTCRDPRIRPLRNQHRPLSLRPRLCPHGTTCFPSTTARDTKPYFPKLFPRFARTTPPS